MKTHWFPVLSPVLGIAGLILLSGSIFGSEVRWAKPANSESAAPAVTHIPAAIPNTMPTEKMFEVPSIVQVQRLEPAQVQRLAPPPPLSQLDGDYLMVAQNPPPGAVIGGAPIPASVGNAPAATPRGATVDCTELIRLKSIRDISYDIRPAPSIDRLPDECTVDSEPYYGRHFSQSCFMWKASALSTQAAYFEDVQLDRYGNTIVCPALQPVVSGAKFFATIPLLPYKMGVTPPNECVYTLGHRRPGNCAPYMVEPLPISLRGALFQTGAVAGAVIAVP